MSDVSREEFDALVECVNKELNKIIKYARVAAGETLKSGRTLWDADLKRSIEHHLSVRKPKNVEAQED